MTHYIPGSETHLLIYHASGAVAGEYAEYMEIPSVLRVINEAQNSKNGDRYEHGGNETAPYMCTHMPNARQVEVE